MSSISRLILALMLLLYTYCSYSDVVPHAEYSLDFIPIQEGQTCINVTNTFKPNKNNEVTLIFPRGSVSNVSISTADFIGANLNQFTRNFKFKTSDKVTFSYTLCQSNPLHHIDYPSLEEDYIYFVPSQVLLLPYSEADELWNFDLEIRNKLKNSIFLSSLGPLNSNHISTTQYLSEFSSFVIASSNHPPVHLQQNSISLYLLSHKNQRWIDETTKKRILSIIDYQYKLMGDNSDVQLIVNLVPTAGGHYILGRHLTKAISIWIPDDRALHEVLLTLAHENFHNWIGFDIRYHDAEDSMLWFDEGINDYLAILTAYQSQAVSQDQVIQYINTLIKKYESSPFKSLTYQELNQLATTNIKAKMIASIRGHLAALTLSDYSINPKNNEYFKAVTTILNIDNPTTEDILTSFKRSLGNEKFNKFKKLIDNMETMPNAAALFDGKFVLNKQVTQIPVYGFDQKDFYQENIIRNIDTASPAYKAGLRNDMKIIGSNINTKIQGTWYFNVLNENHEVVQLSFTPEFTEAKISLFRKAAS